MDASEVKVMATPEAYELITNPADGDRTKEAVEVAVSMALGKQKMCPGYTIENCPLAIWTRPNPFASHESIMLIYKSDGFLIVIPDHKFAKLIETATPIPIV